jgi:MFS transporter, FHS family, L-fucose permease
MATHISSEVESGKLKGESSNYFMPLLIIFCLMFIWNLSRNINDVLIPHLKRALQLTDFQSSLVQSAFFGAYFCMSIPAGLFLKKFGYKNGIIAGLAIAGIGALLFYPAAETRIYPIFLLGLFVLASGFTFLEVTATPYVSILGDPEKASSRLSISAALGSLGASIGPWLAALMILHKEDVSVDYIKSLSPDALNSFLQSEADMVKQPYMYLIAVLVVLIIITKLTKLPEIEHENATGEDKTSVWDALKFKHTRNGMFAEFCYMVAEVGMVSFIIRYCKFLELPGVTEQYAARYISAFMICVLIGRILGGYILTKFKPNRVLFVMSIITILLVAGAITFQSIYSIYCIVLVGLSTSMVFPIVFTLSIKNLGIHTKSGSSLMFMCVVGGAFGPPIMGLISDNSSIRWAFIVPLLCYIVMAWYAKTGSKIEKIS